MRRIVAIFGASATLAAAATGTIVYWRRNPRAGTKFVNVVVNPGLLRRGLAGGEKSELGTIEHVGRKSGIRRLTPVHPEPTPEGFRIIVPLGEHSEWARNVLAAGHCRLQLHDQVYDLDEPVALPAGDALDLPMMVRFIVRALGFQYLTLHTFAVNPGFLEPIEAQVSDVEHPEPAPTVLEPQPPEPAPATS
jgi:deazaflavin-dependent oxidoreductase (nitroreductase family)